MTFHSTKCCCPAARCASGVVQKPSSHPSAWNETNAAQCNQFQCRHTRGRRKPAIKQKRSAISIRSRPWTQSMHAWAFAVLLCILLCSRHAEAGPHHEQCLGKKSELLFDRRQPPSAYPPAVRLKARNDDQHSDIAHPDEQKQANPQIPLPSPFDSSLGNNFTSPSCPRFFQNFLSNQSFQECLPFSLLLQTSNGFFTDTRSTFRLTQTLDYTCQVNLPKCSALMSSLAQQIQSTSTCGSDLQMQNPTVVQAYNGFIAYEPLYHAGCMTNQKTGDYCFADAATNRSSPTSSYIYYLPLGTQMPGGTQPTCDSCLRRTMQVFAAYATNSTQPLSTDYQSAAEMIDMTCGPRFVDSSVQMSTAAGRRVDSFGKLGFGAFVAAMAMFLLI